MNLALRPGPVTSAWQAFLSVCVLPCSVRWLPWAALWIVYIHRMSENFLCCRWQKPKHSAVLRNSYSLGSSNDGTRTCFSALLPLERELSHSISMIHFLHSNKIAAALEGSYSHTLVQKMSKSFSFLSSQQAAPRISLLWLVTCLFLNQPLRPGWVGYAYCLKPIRALHWSWNGTNPIQAVGRLREMV